MECWGLSMRKSWLYWPLTMIHLLMIWQTQGGCIEEERKALLEIKSSYLKSFDSKFDEFLPTWVDHGNSTPGDGSGDCCDWERVTCNTTTSHVTDLSLDSLTWSNIYFLDKNKLWSLNFSLFLHFKELRSLDLSDNSLEKEYMKTGLERLSSLKKLEVLDLSWNYDIDNTILPSLRTLTSLRNLDLSYTSLNGNFPINEFAALENLEMLHLTGCRFNGTFEIQGSERVSILRKLKTLNLRENRFNASVVASLSSLSSLTKLDLSNNSLSGPFPAQGLCELKNLNELYLSGNMIDGTLPQCLKNLSSLKLLDISSNRFTGILERSLIANLTSLEYIDFSYNNFEGSFSFSSFSNHTKLEFVVFRSDNVKFEVETEDPIGWIPMFQLKVLALPNCNINRHKGRVVPGFLIHQHKLQALDLSHNSLKGQFPNWFFKKNTNLEVLELRNNSLVGSMVPLYWNANMTALDMSENQMIGSIPDDIPKFFPNIIHLILSRNVFTGAIPSSIGDLSELEILDLSDNELSGEVPLALFTNISNLAILKLSKNKLYGEILSRNLSFNHIDRVQLDSNHFSGKIGIKRSKENANDPYTLLDISNNFFTGIIPDWIGNTSDISELVVRNNSLEGRFPCGAAAFSFLDISHNSFSGPIPSCLNLQDMEHLHLGSNIFTGSIPSYFRNMTKILTLDIGNNDLSGGIPDFLGELSTLRILLLRKNNFSGSIPKKLCQLSNASLIDLSDNSLSGSIPSCLQNILGPTDLAFLQSPGFGYGMRSTYSYRSGDGGRGSFAYSIDTSETQDEVQFTTKSLSLTYKGKSLDQMAGLDLSCNKLTGEIPEELGLMTQILALNLSHNQLIGPIPVNLSNLANLESLDLSSNGLTDKVPSELNQLTFLSIFNVSYNNLSGTLPEMKAQFGTFTKESYEGNPLLCGPPLKKKCTTAPHVTDPSMEEEVTEKWNDVDMTCFYGSSISTLVLFLLVFVALLYINPYWRKWWLDLVEECMFKCYYFLYDSVRKSHV